jgi:hypothetical protein
LPPYDLLSAWRSDAGNPSVEAFRAIAAEVSRGLLAELCPGRGASQNGSKPRGSLGSVISIEDHVSIIRR